MTRLHLVLPAVLLTLAVPPATAQTWTGAAGDGNWNNAANWNPATIPNAATAAVTFGSAGAGTVNIASSVQAGSLNFTNIGTGNYILTSSAGQTLSGLTAIYYLNSTFADSGTQTINFSPNSGGNLVSGSGPLTITNNAGFAAVVPIPGLMIGPDTVIGTAGGGGVVFAGSGITTLSGSFASGSNTVNGGLTKTGPGQLIFSGDGTQLGGGLTLNGGTLTLDYTTNAASKLGSGNLTLSGGSLQLNANGSAASQTVGGTTLAANHTEISAAATAPSTNVTLDLGAITRSAGATVNFSPAPFTGANANFILPTSTGSTNGLLGTGPAYATFAGMTWAMSSIGQVAPLSAYASNTYSPGSNTDYVGPYKALVADTTTNSIRFNYSATSVLDIPNLTLTLQSGGLLMTPSSGPVAIGGYGAGTLTTPGGTGELLVHQYDNAHALTINTNIVTSGGLTKTGYGNLLLGGTNTGLTGPINVNQGSLYVTNTAAVNSASTINLNDNSDTTNPYLTVELFNGVSGTVSTNIRLSSPGKVSVINTGTNSNSTITLSGVISSISGQETSVSFGYGQDITDGLSVIGNNTFLGGVFVEGGTLGINSNASLGNAGNTLSLAVGSSTAGGLLFLNGGIDLARPVILDSFNPSRIVSNGSDVNTISGGVYGGGRVYKAGYGALILSATNAYSGGTQIDAGTLSVGADANLGAATTSVSINGGATLGVSGSFSTARPLLIGPTSTTAPNGPANIAVAAGQTFTPTGDISDNFGPGTLALTGPGTVVLNTANSYSGGTVVQRGTLQVAIDGALGAATAPVTVNALGTLTYTATTTTARPFTLNFGTLGVAAGQTLTLNGASVGGGYLAGPGNFAVTGGTGLIGVTTYASTPMNLTGPASLANFSNGGPLTVAGGVTGVNFTRFTNQGSGAITVGAASAVNVGDFQTYGTLAVNPATVTENFSQTTLVTNTGTTQQFFNGGSRTFVGTPSTAVFPQNWPDQSLRGLPTFVAGIDLNGKNATVAGGLFVNNGYVEDSSNNFAGTGALIADFGSLVKGAGYFQNTVQTINGGKFQAGNSPGKATFGQFILGPGGVDNYLFAIDDATGAAGPSPDVAGHVSGWGLVKAVYQAVGGRTTTGDFTWSATPADKLAVSLETLLNPTTVGTDVPGLMDHFEPTRSYAWPAVEWTGAYAGPIDAATLDAATAFDTSGFANPIAGSFGWALDGGGHTLSLTYTPSAVPEPGTLALVGLASAGMAWRRRWIAIFRRKCLTAATGPNRLFHIPA